METYWKSNNSSRRDWLLLTPPEWIESGFEIVLVEGPPRKTDGELEEFIDNAWEARKAYRKKYKLPSEDAWPKIGYADHDLDLDNRKVTVEYRDANWKALTSTNLNPEFYDIMLERFNSQGGKQLDVDKMHYEPAFRKFILPYLDGSLAQCSAVNTFSGYPIGLRSPEMGEAAGDWHVPGSWIPAIGEDVHRKGVPVVNNDPIWHIGKFKPDVASLEANGLVNLFVESGGVFLPRKDALKYVGLVYELPGHTVEFMSIVDGKVMEFKHDPQHVQMMHLTSDYLPQFLSMSDNLVPAGQSNLVAAYVNEIGPGSLEAFSFVSET